MSNQPLDDALELVLKTRIEGADEAREAAQAARDFARAERTVARALVATAEAQERLNAAQQQRSAGSGSGASANNFAVAAQRVAVQIGGGGGGGSSNSGGSGGGGASSTSSGPFSRLTQLTQKLAQAKNSGASEDTLRDLEYRRTLAQKHVARITAPDPTTAQKMAQAVLTSRFGIGGAGGQMMPLVGKSLSAMGISGGAATALMTNPYVLAGAAVLKFAQSAVTAANEAAQAGREFSALRHASGGTTAESAQLSVLGRVTGTDMGALSQRIHERMTSDPAAMAMAARMGAHATPGPHGTTDYAKNTLKVVEGLRRIQDRQERLRAARALGAEEALPLTLINNRLFKRLKVDSDVTAGIMDPEFEKQSAEFETAKKRTGGGTEAVKTAMGKKFLPTITGIMNGYADVAYSVASFLNGDGFATLGNGDGTYGQAGKRVGGGGPGRSLAQADRDAALRANTSMLADTNTALGRLTKELGGGERARGAMPSALRSGDNLRRAREMGALRLGYL